MRVCTLIIATALAVVMSVPVGGNRINFAQYKTCKQCTGAGFGWCSIKRICGGFANRQCGEGERFVRADYDPSQAASDEAAALKAAEEKKKEDDEKKRKQEEEKRELKEKLKLRLPTRETFPSAIEFAKPGHVLPLHPAKAEQTISPSKDYWAVYYYSKQSQEKGGLGNKDSLSFDQWSQIAKATRRIGLLLAMVNLDDVKEGGQSFFGQWKHHTSTPSISVYLDNRDEVPQLELSADVVSEGPAARMETVVSFITTEVSTAVLGRANGVEKKRRAEKMKDRPIKKAEEQNPPPPIKKKPVLEAKAPRVQSDDEDALDDSF